MAMLKMYVSANGKGTNREWPLARPFKLYALIASALCNLVTYRSR